MRWIALPLLLALPALAEFDDNLYRSLTEKQARVNGRAGGAFDFRVTSTDRSFNYKLRATWIAQDVSSALARELVSAKGVLEERALSAFRALDDDWYYFLVELDPREGSGVIPRGWVARFGPQAQPNRAVLGEVLPETEAWNLVARAFPRDYAYDIFLIRVAKKTGDNKTLEMTDSEAELTVGIYNKIGHVRWPLPERSR